jgi:very-short-patch-repair endonuclease
VLERRVLGDEVADSTLEGALAELLSARGVLCPVHHQLVSLPTGDVYELDYSYLEARLYLEFEGYGAHLISRERFEDDRERQNQLTLAGWRPLRFTRRMVLERPGRVAALVEAALRDPASS